MTTSLTKKMGAMVAVLSCLMVGYAVAQQAVREYERESGAAQQRDAADPAGQSRTQITERGEYTAGFRGTPGTAGADQEVQKFLASCLLSKNKAEVEFAQLAQQQSQNPEVKEFAQMLVKDHSQLVQKLQPLAGAQAATTRTETRTDATGQIDAQTRIGQTATGQNAALKQLAEIDKAIGERCKEALREELQSKQGAEFDKCYVGSQIAGHMQSVATLEVLEQQGPDQLKQLAQQARPTVQQHLDHAKQLMKQLEGASPADTRAARQPDGTQR